MTEQDKVTVDDIIGIVKTEEQTNSVEEVRKLRGRGNETAKRFTLAYETNDQNCIWWAVRNGDITLWKEEVVDLLNEQHETIQRLQENITELLVVDIEKELLEENEQLKKEISIFEGEDAGHYQRWVAQIKKYVDESNPNFEYDEDFIIKIALSYTLQSLRNGESLKRFQWEYKELEE